MKIQFTFYNPTHKFMPISVTLDIYDKKEKMSSLYARALDKVCIERNWTKKELKEKYEYTKYRYRLIKES